MKALTILNLLLAIGATAGCKAPPSTVLPPKGDAAAKDDVSARFGGYKETIEAAKAAGYDYIEIVTNSVLRQEDALHRLFEMTSKAHLDAASAEGHSQVLGCVLHDAGDRFFGERLSLETASVQKAVREYVADDLGYGHTSISVDEIRHMYPKTFPPGCKF